jgi:hypothetical protein
MLKCTYCAISSPPLRHKEPPIVGAVLESLGNVYDALALFTLGMAMAVPNLPPLDARCVPTVNISEATSSS